MVVPDNLLQLENNVTLKDLLNAFNNIINVLSNPFVIFTNASKTTE